MRNIFLTLFIFLLIGCSGSNSTKKASSSDGKPTIIRFESSDLYETIGGFKSLVPKYNKNGPRYLFRVLKNKPYDEDGYQFQQGMAKQDEYGNYTTWDRNVGKKFIVTKAFYDEVQKFDNIKYITGATMDDIMNNTAVVQTEIGKKLYNIVKSCGEDNLWWFLGDENPESRDCIVKMPGEAFTYSDNNLSSKQIEDLISNHPGIQLDERFVNNQGQFDEEKFRVFYETWVVDVYGYNYQDWINSDEFLQSSNIWKRDWRAKSLNNSFVCDNNKLEESKKIHQRTSSEQRRASHILISYSGAQGSTPQITRTKDEARTEVNRILKLVNSNPDNFNCIAYQNSDGPSKTYGGDIGYFDEGLMVKKFSDYVFKNEVGSIGIVETDFGFHIIYITEV